MARKKKHGDDHGGVHPDERWLVTYADMITLLLAVFIVLYALSDTNTRKFVAFAQSVSSAFNTDIFKGTTAYTVTSGQETAPDVQEFDAGQGVVATDYRAIDATVSDYVLQSGLQGQVSVDRVPEGIAIRISNSFLFQSGRARLDEKGREVLDKIISVVDPLPNPLRIEGHTDDIAPTGPFFTDNWQLSTGRALAVLNLMRGEGVASSRLSAAGYAENKPLVPNTDEKARARNRRVDILILYDAPVSSGDASAPLEPVPSPIGPVVFPRP